MFLRRFAGFARRFSPLWIVWLLIALVPASREVAQLHWLGSPLLEGYGQPWRQSFGRGREFNGFRVAKKKPRDLNAQLWRFSLGLRGLRDNVDDEEVATTYGYTNRNPNYAEGFSTPQQLLEEARVLQKAFPEEKWLSSLPIRVVARRLDSWSDKTSAMKNAPSSRYSTPTTANSRLSDAGALRLARVAQNAAKSEPNNAYYALVEAEIWRRNSNSAAMWRALNRAAKCTVFETHDLEFARAIVAAHEAIRPLLLEEKNEVWRASNGSDGRTFDAWTTFLGHEGRAARNRGDHRRVLEIAAILASVGDLMQHGTNTRAMALTGNNWKSNAWALTPRPKFKRGAGRAWYQRRTEHFAAYATKHGRKNVAARVPKWAARQRELFYLNEESAYSGSSFSPAYASNAPIMNPSKRDLFARASKWRDAGVFVLLHGLFVALFWLVANLFLWRGAGAPSTRKDRAIPALSMLVLSAILAFWVWHQFEIFEAASSMARWNPARAMQEGAVASVGIFAFFGAPFLLAAACAAATMFRQKREFLASARIETELRLGARDALILRSSGAILCALSLFSSLGLWLLWLLLVGLDVRILDPLAWLPQDRYGRSWSAPQQVEMLLAPLGYCLFLSFLSFVLWFAKWRYFGGREKRALTHGGLRRWKESLGAYLVLVSALYFAVALASWPARAQAARELEIRIARGELWP